MGIGILIYCIIAIILFTYCLVTVSEGRKIDGSDVYGCFFLFGVFWPFGVIIFIGLLIADLLNEKHKR